jgi:predicted phage terminase large subunit-like protein
MTEIRPQPGPQTDFLSSPADIVIYGGAAGGGKSYGLLLEALRHVHNPQFGGVIFRRTTVQIKVEGGLWDTSGDIYPMFGGRGLSQPLVWHFPSGAKIKFSHMEHEKNRIDWGGSQIPFIGFDELTHFTAAQFWFMMGRNRSDSGVSGYIRATCNPDPDSFVRKLVDWWIDRQSGFPVKGRAGVVRYFVRHNDELHWAFSKKELRAKFGESSAPKSLTFIPASIYDNRILLESDPNYLASLKALPYVERAQLLEGNWNVRPAAGAYFRRHYFGVVPVAPAEVVLRVRFWDRAATPKLADNDPDATVGVLMSRDKAGVFYVEDVRRMFETPFKVNDAIQKMAKQDPPGTVIAYNQDPASAGVYEARQTALDLAGHVVQFETKTKKKEVMAGPVSSQAEAGNIKVVEGAWNEDFFRELENFPVGRYDDTVDALSGAFKKIVEGRKIYVA